MGMKTRSSSPSTQRAWRLLRLALLWARKGGIMKCRLLVAELRHISKHLKSSLRPHHHHRPLAHYGERQLSFDETPVIHMRMRRPAGSSSSLWFMIPACMKPVDHVFDSCDFEVNHHRTEEEEIRCLYGDGEMYGQDEKEEEEEEEEEEVRKEESVDEKADEFINKFYREMKLQRQISYLQYTDMMISRGANQ